MPERFVTALRRDLGTLESYAALLGILIGAGIFTVTSRAWILTGPSVILGYVILLPVVLATSVPYAAFLSTPLGREPGGEYTHISRTLGGYRIAFIGTWLKIISYIGALAFLATALADYMIQFAGGRPQPAKPPMSQFASFSLPAGAAWFVTFGAIMAVTTSINSTMLVPSRLAIILARDGLAPPWVGTIHPHTGTPIRGLTLTLAAATILLISGQISLALNIAVFALVVLYFLHSLTFLLLPRRNPRLYSLINISLSSSVQRAAALLSVLTMGGIIAIQVVQDLRTLGAQTFRQR